MAEVDGFRAARREIERGLPAPVYHLIGGEELLKDELVAEIIAHAVDPSARDFNVDARLAADIDGESLHALVETPPMLAERRVVVIKYIDQWRKNAKVWQVLERYLAHPSPTTTLVLTEAPKEKWTNPLEAQLRRGSKQVSCETLGRDALRAWVHARTESLNLQIEPAALDHLIAVTQGHLGTLASELHKLSAAADGTLTADDVANFVGVRRGETPDDWMHAVLHRDAPRAIGMLDRLLGLPNSNGVRLVGTLGSHLLGLRLAVGRGRRRGNASTLTREFRSAKLFALGRPEQVVPLWVDAAALWSEAEVDGAIRAAYDADRALKSTRTSTEAGVLTDLILACAATRQAA